MNCYFISYEINSIVSCLFNLLLSTNSKLGFYFFYSFYSVRFSIHIHSTITTGFGKMGEGTTILINCRDRGSVESFVKI